MTTPRLVPRAILGWIPLALLFAVHAFATPLDFIPVGDPLEDELRFLEITGSEPALPHFGMRPLQIEELPDFARPSADSAVALGFWRLHRALARDRPGLEPPGPSTPRSLQLASAADQRFEFSAGLEGRGSVARDRDPWLSSGSGVHLRFGAQTGRWLGFAHVLAGEVEDGLQYAEAILPGGEAVLHSDEAFLAYTGDSTRWAAQFGRSRWHWGPGYEGSLLLSRTSAALDGMGVRFGIPALRADAMILSSTLESTAGERLAAHRLEWHPHPAVRVGVAEAVRYQSSTPELLYVAGVLPYTLVQNILVRAEPDSFDALRNNIIVSLDAAWRIAPGSRVYGELLIDDLRTDESQAIHKLGGQLGLEGVGTIRERRVTWGVEFTRLSRFVYTSYFDRRFVHEERPIGFPTGPDSRRITVRGTWDPSRDWQLWAVSALTDIGESGIDDPYVPGSPSVPVFEFAGVVETSREVEVGLRWWPASGVDMSLSAGFRQTDNPGHVSGATEDEVRGSLAVRLVR